eukprot:8410445-Alexandrium_andersonii.AAC.1
MAAVARPFSPEAAKVATLSAFFFFRWASVGLALVGRAIGSSLTSLRSSPHLRCQAHVSLCSRALA